MQERRVERQAREVEQLRRRLMFELLVLESLLARRITSSADAAPEKALRNTMSLSEVRGRAEQRAAGRLIEASRTLLAGKA